MQPEALIFDVDGTLAETEEAHRVAFNAAFAAAGLDWHWGRARYTALLAVTGGKERIAHWCRSIGVEVDDPVIRALHADKTVRYSRLVAGGAVALRPGVRTLVETARAEGVRLAIATTTSRPNVDALIEAAFGEPSTAVFEVIAAGDEVPLKKPDPAVYRLALERLGVPAGATAALEDSANGVRAARAAGIACVATPGVYTTGDDFTGAAVIESLEGLGPSDVMALAASAHGTAVHA
ncbi:phosphatase [Acuticoccus sediminis]|uniref:Phosphatase n=1 Tax=Acuticoccus sediminis TaxID=2184697 RepID=A0A8B2NR97_9HYPH|nr:HAD-IA family hydrolase [Acuticoccus sediminis]RAI00830.1 phosphatase [Acuticoccus sediminis]